MPISVRCTCGKSFQAKDELSGKRVRCPSCGGAIEIPFAATASDDPLGLGNFGGAMPWQAAPVPGASSYGQAGVYRATTAAKPKAQGNSNLALWIGLGVGGVLAILVGCLVVGFLLLGGGDETAAVVAPAIVAPAGTEVAASGSPTTAQQLSSSSSAAASPQPATAPQKFKATAPWPEQADIDIPIPVDGNDLIYSATPSPFVVVGLNVISKPGVQVWDLSSGKRVGELSDTPKSSEYAVSPDGVYLAAIPSGFGGRGKVQIFSFKTGKQVVELKYGGDQDIAQYIAFAKPDTLVIHTLGQGPGGFERSITAWSIPGCEQKSKFVIKELYQRTHFAMSPDGRHLAGIAGKEKVSLFDLETGAVTSEFAVEDLMGGRQGVYRGMSYSPDGKLLGIVYSETNSVVVFLDVTSGQIADQVAFAGKPPTASAYKGAAVEWMGDRAWCLFGGTVIDRPTKQVVWNLDLPITSRLTPRKTLAGGWVMKSGPHRKERLVFMPSPDKEIQASLKAMASTSPAHLRPGMSISLDIKVGQLRSGTAQDTSKRLTDIFTTRFEGDKISIADGQPTVLKVEYSESAGRMLQERKGIGAEATGQTVQSTQVLIKLNLTSRDGGSSFFEHTIDYNPHGVSITQAGGVNEATVRDSVFRQLLFALSEAPIPYFVPQESTLSKLPGVTKIE